MWKWLIISLHSAMQGACVFALRGHDTAGVTVLEEKWAKKWSRWYGRERHKEQPDLPPYQKLASLPDLFERVRDPKCLPPPHTLVVGDEVVADIKWLNERRNEFVHFVLDGASLELTEMPRIVGRCCEVVEHLAVQHPTFGLHLDEPRPERIAAALTSLRAGVAAWAAAQKS